MEQTVTQITSSRYHFRRIGLVVAIAALIVLAVKPALALFNTPPEFLPVQASAPVTPAGAGLASAVMTGLDDPMPTINDFPDLRVTAALVKELGASKPLFVYHPTARWPLASVSKLMTAVVALDDLGPATILTVSQSAVDTEGVAGGLKAGEKYSVIDLVRALLTVSSNDAAMVLAEAYDAKHLDKEAYERAINKTALFTAAMQQKARDLGMSETYYGDPSGLSVVNQSIITDLEALTNHIVVSHPELLEITRKKENKVLERRTMTWHILPNINQLAGQADFLGGKTGETEEAGGNLLSLFKYNGKQYLIIVLGTESAASRFTETTKLYEWVKTL